ncbi:phosphotyrosine protein phosphatase [Halioglobus japonicus]|uniref:protein-tyrosine-phosphatase n=1 Tax=Halioglobus japonicus TaxID=930805 RepID=A0AAP8MFF1_9GAMM|nr:low molecular weight protein-tyrosine-phosphatase [Halioglobus japonicus]AQA18770.1 phosphotyrosine protein phosphatase [Halioglobus japonicus]PLW86802.1 low molecular weight phosphotyrosine protein phosphatase [Halioglobus japonicus]GHD10995.1 phosphotyrosine protein phosphatase [Halioglobus japonicus]
MTRVLFVCLGNICRSPTAHGVFQSMVDCRGLQSRIAVDSCGTGDWHIGHAPDKRATAEAAERGYDLTPLRARQVTAADFDEFDYIVAMDNQNLADLRAMCPTHFSGYLGLFLPFAAVNIVDEVPDPYYGGPEGFTQVLDMVEAASEGLLAEIERADSSR